MVWKQSSQLRYSADCGFGWKTCSARFVSCVHHLSSSWSPRWWGGNVFSAFESNRIVYVVHASPVDFGAIVSNQWHSFWLVNSLVADFCRLPQLASRLLSWHGLQVRSKSCVSFRFVLFCDFFVSDYTTRAKLVVARWRLFPLCFLVVAYFMNRHCCCQKN